MTGQSNWHNEGGFNYMLFPAKNGKAKNLVICLHGIGADARIEPRFMRALQDKLPDADIISLQAPFKITQSLPGLDITSGYSWLPFDKHGEIKPQAKAWLSHIFNRMTIAERVEAFSKSQLDRRGLSEKNLAYIGTSMGGIVALQAGLSAKEPVAAIVSRGSTVLPLTRVKSKPPVFLQMGEKDELFNRAPKPKPNFLRRIFSRAAKPLGWRHERSIHRLKKNGVPMTEKIYPSLGHTLDFNAWNDGIDFVAKLLPQPPKPPAAPKPGP